MHNRFHPPPLGASRPSWRLPCTILRPLPTTQACHACHAWRLCASAVVSMGAWAYVREVDDRPSSPFADATVLKCCGLRPPRDVGPACPAARCLYPASTQPIHAHLEPSSPLSAGPTRGGYRLQPDPPAFVFFFSPLRVASCCSFYVVIMFRLALVLPCGSSHSH